MADNFTVLKQQLDTAINPNAAPGQIYAQDHNDWDTAFMKMQGKYVGSPFIARRAFNGVANAGDLYWNGALNDTNGIEIITAKTTADLNDFGLILSRIGSGDLIHAKDYEGRSVFFEFKSYTEDVDNNNNVIYRIQVIPDGNNVNYYYQPTDEFICILEVVKSKSSGMNPFEGVEIDLFWNRRGYAADRPDSDFFKSVGRKKFVAKDVNGIEYYKTLKTKVYHLGVEIKNFDSIKGLKPRIMIERFKRPRRNHSDRGNGREQTNSPAGYKYTNFFQSQIIAYVGNGMYNYIDRPILHDLIDKRVYLDINAENYFSQVDPPKALGNQHFVTYPKPQSVDIIDDSNNFKRSVPKRRKGHAHCRIRLVIEIDKIMYISQPMVYFKITNHMLFDDQANEIDVIKYSFE